jgi:hypothetical protein
MIMKKIKKIVAFKKMTEMFGPWKTWSRAVHLTYGLIRGIAYSRMEKCSNDNPPIYWVAYKLWELGAFEAHPPPAKEPDKFRSLPREVYKHVKTLIVWLKKEPRIKKIADEVTK